LVRVTSHIQQIKLEAHDFFWSGFIQYFRAARAAHQEFVLQGFGWSRPIPQVHRLEDGVTDDRFLEDWCVGWNLQAFLQVRVPTVMVGV
jgi:hypothetical protein